MLFLDLEQALKSVLWSQVCHKLKNNYNQAHEILTEKWLHYLEH